MLILLMWLMGLNLHLWCFFLCAFQEQKHPLLQLKGHGLEPARSVVGVWTSNLTKLMVWSATVNKTVYAWISHQVWKEWTHLLDLVLLWTVLFLWPTTVPWLIIWRALVRKPLILGWLSMWTLLSLQALCHHIMHMLSSLNLHLLLYHILQTALHGASTYLNDFKWIVTNLLLQCMPRWVTVPLLPLSLQTRLCFVTPMEVYRNLRCQQGSHQRLFLNWYLGTSVASLPEMDYPCTLRPTNKTLSWQWWRKVLCDLWKRTCLPTKSALKYYQVYTKHLYDYQDYTKHV